GDGCCVRQTGDDPRTLEQRTGAGVTATGQRTAGTNDLLHGHGDENLVLTTALKNTNRASSRMAGIREVSRGFLRNCPQLLWWAPVSGHRAVTRHFRGWSGHLICKAADVFETRVQSAF